VKKNLTLKSKLILSFAILISIPLCVSVFVTYKMSSSVTERNAEELIAEKLNDKAVKMNEMASQVDRLSMSISSSDELQSLLSEAENKDNYERFNSFLLGIRMNQSIVNNIRVYDERQKETFMNNSWYKETVEKKGVGIWSSSSNKLLFRRAVPSLEKPGEMLGVIEIDISSDKISGILEDLKKDDYTQTSYLIKNDYDIFDPDRKFNKKMIEYINKEHSGNFLIRLNDDDVFVHYKRIDKTDWILVNLTLKNEVFGDLYAVQKNIFFYIVFTVIFSIILAYLISNQLVKPIIQLINNTKKIEEGDLAIASMMYKKDEIGELTSRFQLMAKKLSQYIKNILDSTSLTKRVFRKVSDNSHDVASVFALISDRTDEIVNQISTQDNEIRNGLFTVRNLTSNINEVVDRIDNANDRVKETNELSKKGNEAIDHLTSEVNIEIATIDKIVGDIKELDDVSRAISNITMFIQDISLKIEILALNASIEANRMGRNHGFIVISDEIKKLSDLTKMSLSDILSIIDESNQKINQISKKTSLIKDSQGKKHQLIEETRLSFDKISNSVDLIGKDLKDLLNHSDEMDKNKDLIVDLISYISYVSKQTTEHCVKVNEEIKRQEPSLLELISTVSEAEKELSGLNKKIDIFKLD